jgi:glycosyltransferase involved in cell wall biosynthesis
MDIVTNNSKPPHVAQIGVVLIGKNEGQRLVAALSAIQQIRGMEPAAVVYVDSNSTDNSVMNARAAGAHVVLLDPQAKFTAALARNTGYARLKEILPDVEFVQFIDGDCALDADWLCKAHEALQAEPDLAGVCGRRREKYPEKSVYNAICDFEWDTPVGLTDATGGDAMFRREALDEVGGYDVTLIAGEEPEMCRRMASKGYRFRRIDAEMTLHDADMHHFSQWWKRNVRAGHAFAEVSRMCRLERNEAFWDRSVRGNYLWGNPLAWPLWPIQWVRLYRRDSNAVLASHLVVCKLPQMLGQLKYRWNLLRGRSSGLIDYKPGVPIASAK